MAGEESSLFSFFFYVLFVYPATNWLLRPGRFSRSKSIAYAIAFLVAVAAVKTGLEISERGPNHYALLDVTRSSSTLEIKRAYKRMSLELHPDKNHSPTAVDDFAHLKEAYDTLMDSEMKDVYARFGEEGVKQNKRVDEYRMLLEMLVFYVAQGVMAFMLTLGKASSGARQNIFTGLIAMLIVEVMLMLQEVAMPDWFLPQTTEHEIVMLLHNLFPAFLNGCRCIGAFLYVDLEEQARNLLLALHEQNKDVLVALREMASAFAAGAGASAAGVGAVPTPTQKLKELEATLRGTAEAPHPAASLLKSDADKSNIGLYVMIAGYIALYYCFSS